MALTPTRLEHVRRRNELLRSCRRDVPNAGPFVAAVSVLMGAAIVLLVAEQCMGISL